MKIEKPETMAMTASCGCEWLVETVQDTNGIFLSLLPCTCPDAEDRLEVIIETLKQDFEVVNLGMRDEDVN